MTEQFKILMHTQAASVDFAAPDLEAMVRTGDRRVRTRRLGALAGAAAALAAVAVTASLLSWPDRAVAPATDIGPPLAWVDGTTLHEGDRTDELGFRPVAFVRTEVGYVFSDREGGVWSWVDGDVREVGSTSATRPHLVADEESGLAGWLAPAPGSREVVGIQGGVHVVLDQRTGATQPFPTDGGRYDPGGFVAIDDSTAYWLGADGLIAFDLDTRRSTTIDIDGTVADVEDGLVAVRTDAGISVRDLAGEEVRILRGFRGIGGSFSPDAHYLTNDADEPQVYGVATGAPVEIPVGTRAFASSYEWLDGTTLALVASDKGADDSPVELVTCSVPDGPCQDVTTLGTFAAVVERLVLPVGTAMDE